MRSSIVPALIGVSTIALTTIAAPAPAAAAVFQAESGVTSVFLNFEEVLSPLGINLVGADNVTTPAEGPFQVGFTITPETNFTFSHEDGFTPISGTIEHVGSVTLSIDTLADNVTVGNFTIGFDPNRASDTLTGFFVQDTLSLNAILFDITTPPTGFNLTSDELLLGSGLAISPEFASVLEQLGKPNLSGAVVGEAQVNANLQASTASVPEPSSILGLLAMGAIAVSGHRRLRNK